MRQLDEDRGLILNMVQEISMPEVKSIASAMEPVECRQDFNHQRSLGIFLSPIKQEIQNFPILRPRSPNPLPRVKIFR